MKKEALKSSDPFYRLDSNPYYLLDKNFIQKPLEFGRIFLYQIGRRFCSDNVGFGKHVHLNWFELTIATGGKGKITANDKEVDIFGGDIFLSFPCESHKIDSDEKDPLKYDFFSFYTNDDGLKEQLESIIYNFHDAKSRLFKDDNIRNLVGTAIAEMNDTDDFSNEILTNIFNQIILYLIRDFKKDRVHNPSAEEHTEVLCYKVMNYIDSHIYSIKTLSDLYPVMNYNYSYLSTLFKKTTNGTLADYFHKKKLSTAKLLLTERKLKIGEIASLLNYSSVYSFSKAFKNEYGVSPKNFNKK